MFVLAANPAAQLHTPHLERSGPIAERLERKLHLDRPAALELPGPDIPNGVPVSVGIPFIRNLGIGEHSQRIGDEAEPVASIVERIEEHAEDVVLHELAVAPQLVRDPLTRGRRVPDARRHIDRAPVEHDPGFGLLGRRGTLVRHLLDEPGDGRNRVIHLLVKAAIETNSLGELDGTDRRPPLSVAGDDLGGDRRGWAIDDQGRHREPARRHGGCGCGDCGA